MQRLPSDPDARAEAPRGLDQPELMSAPNTTVPASAAATAPPAPGTPDAPGAAGAAGRASLPPSLARLLPVARRHRGRRVWRLVVWVGVAFVAATSAGRLLQQPAGSPRTARAATSRQLRLTLEPGERILREAYVYQRHWWDLFNETRGVLAATDRRLVFVGLPPRDLVARDEGPPAFDVRTFPYDTVTTLKAGRVFLWSERGGTLRRPQGREGFGAPAAEMESLREIARVVERYREGAIQAAFRERWLANMPKPPAPPRLVHLVRPGQALSSIANVYGTTPDVLRQMNQLPGDQIRIGQRLLVPRPDTMAADFTLQEEIANLRPAAPAAR